jgi:nucleoside 2-deoxyribosyltransferase
MTTARWEETGRGTMTKIYLAGPLFTLAEQSFNTAVARFLESRGYEVWLPQEHEPRSQTARSIFEMDVAAIDWADMVVACMDGPDPDSGTAWECGYAYAKGKPIVCYRTDFRVSGDTQSAPYNLMLSESATTRFEVPFRTPIAEVHERLVARIRDAESGKSPASR